MIKIQKFKNREVEKYIPEMEWTQVENNLTSIGSLIITIDNLKEGECIKITKIKDKKNEN